MKKIFFILYLAIFFISTASAQVFQKTLGENENIDMVIVTKDMFSLITEIDSENKDDIKNFYGKLDYLATYTARDRNPSLQIEKEAKKYVASKGMKLLTKIKNARNSSELYYIPSNKKGYARELLLLIRYTNGKTTLLYVKGDINMKKLSLLALQATGLDRNVLREAEKAVK